VSPYYEDDLPELRDELGATQMIFGSDYPHAEGLADPKSFVDDLPGFSDADVRLVMRENALALAQPRS
jgi:predicted TIM-barrel fold metal-dependent hydrolase